MSIPATLKSLFKSTPAWPLLRPRRIHLYGVGAMKTGTSSLVGMFSDNYHAAHEPHLPETMRLIGRQKVGAPGREIRDALKQRDRRWRLEVESTHFLVFFIEHLVELFPSSRFVLNVRAPHSWLGSAINQCMKSHRPDLVGRRGSWPQNKLLLREHYFGQIPQPHDPQEDVLAENKLPSVDSFLSHWSWHNTKVLDAVPPERLLILRTQDLSDSLHRIAAFADVSEDKLSVRRSHKNKAPRDYQLISEIEPAYLRDKIEEHCAPTIRRIEQEQGVSLTQ